MKINISQKLGLSAALVVSIVGCFSESAEARRGRFSGNSDKSTEAVFELDTDNGGVIEKLMLEIQGDDEDDEKTFASASTGSVNASRFTGSDPNLSELGIELNPDNFPIRYDLTFDQNNLTGLDELTGTLYIPSDSENFSLEGIDLENPSIKDFDKILENNTNEEGELSKLIPGILVRTQDGIRTIDDFGADNSSGFFVKEIKKQDIPEPTTAAGLLAALAVGGLSLRKGDKLKGHGKSDRRVKSKAII